MFEIIFLFNIKFAYVQHKAVVKNNKSLYYIK